MYGKKIKLFLTENKKRGGGGGRKSNLDKVKVVA